MLLEVERFSSVGVVAAPQQYCSSAAPLVVITVLFNPFFHMVFFLVRDPEPWM